MKLKNLVRKVRLGIFVAASALLSGITTAAILQDGSVAQAGTPAVVVPMPHLRPTVIPIQDGIEAYVETDYTEIEPSYEEAYQRALDVLRDTKDDPLVKKVKK